MQLYKDYNQMGPQPRRGLRNKGHLSGLFLTFLLVFSQTTQLRAFAQTLSSSSIPTATTPHTEKLFRLEILPVAGGAELITIHARLDGLDQRDREWTPLVSVLRDSLGDSDPENDRLRYLWPLTYTRPGLGQRLAGAVPFFYTRVGNKRTHSNKPPPPVMDLSAPEKQVWEKIFWTALQTVLLDSYGMPIKASSYSYRRNLSEYRRSQIVRALSVLSLYQAVGGTPAFSDAEMGDIQSRLLLTDKTFGGLVDDLYLQRYYERQVTALRDERGHNWELLRQRAEAESLVFEPLEMPDGSTTHAMLWIAKNELATKREAPYNSRFLNISDPRSDNRLKKWDGYVETRFYDSENRVVAAGTAGAQPVELIPLALYGLDNPKIPMLLVDFRDSFNPTKREMSRRVLQDVTRNFVSLSGAGGMAYFLGRTVFDFATARRGIDINQPSRLRTYSQLKLLLALNNSLEPELKQQIDARLDTVSVNPLENDLVAEVKLAHEQYQALRTYALKPDGLPARLDRDRREELVPLKHNKAEQVLFRLGNILSFGAYTHREKTSPEDESRLEIARRIAYHTRFLRQVAKSTPRVEVAWNLDEVRRSLQFLAAHGPEVGSAATHAAATIFLKTDDDETRRACLDSLAHTNNRKAKDELLRLSQDKRLEPVWKERVLAYLGRPHPDSPIANSQGKSRAEGSGQQ
ncbi:MAG TPA: hypothetical protein VFH15_15010 [Pyrinomonadaceae bacterium]|nr:hypothetical protein [Pyrinomonadaceae bacterium]